MKDCKYYLKILSFFSLGLWTFFTPIIVSYVALEDVLSGTLLPSTVVLITFSIPDITTKVLSPYVINRISFHSVFGLLTLFLVGSYTLLVIIDDARVRIVGVGVLGVAYGFGRITGVKMLSYYEDADVLANSFYNGFGIATLAASLVYTGLTSWTCLAPRIVLCICIPFCFLPLASYLVIDKEPLKYHLKKTSADRQYVEYTSLNDDDQCANDSDTASQNSEDVSKLWLIFKAFPFATYAYLTNFCAHFVMTAVLTTLTFESSPFPPRDHYQYYRFSSNIGFTFGGNIALLFSSCNSKGILKYFRMNKSMLCVLVLLDVSHLLFFVFASWYRFLPNVNVVLVMCFTEGSIHGIAVAVCAANSANEFSSAKHKGTALSLMEVGFSVARFAAALLGLSTEKLLREHCTERLMLGRFCLARPASNAEWNTKLSCSLRH